MSRYALALLIPLLLPSLGCDSEDCTLIGCESEASLVVSMANEDPLEGDLEFLIELDDAAFAVECAADSDGCGSPEGASTSFRVVVRRGISGATLTLAADDPDDMPTDFRLQVVRDGVPILDEAGAFDYSTYEPNGPSCGPTCREADAIEYTVKS